MKIPIDIEGSLWKILSKLPKDECRTFRELSDETGISRDKIRNKIDGSERIKHCKIKVDGGREKVGYINPRYVR